MHLWGRNNKYHGNSHYQTGCFKTAHARRCVKAFMFSEYQWEKDPQDHGGRECGMQSEEGRQHQQRWGGLAMGGWG